MYDFHAGMIFYGRLSLLGILIASKFKSVIELRMCLFLECSIIS